MVRARKPGGDVQLTGDKPAGRAILSAREAFNMALAERNMPGIEAVLSDSTLLVPGDEAEMIQGRQAQLEAWQSIFTQMPDVNYVRSPQRIEVNEDGMLAAEGGRWRGGWSSEGMRIAYSGRYFAKWRHDGIRWLIEAETFVTMKRTGGMV